MRKMQKHLFMKIIHCLAVAIIILLAYSPNVYSSERERSNFGFGLGHSFGGAGVRYDRNIWEKVYGTANIGTAGYHIGVRVKQCISSTGSCVIGTILYGETARFGGHTLDLSTSVSFGVGLEWKIRKAWSMELGGYYVRFLEDNEFRDSDDFRPSIGFVKRFF